VQSISINCVLRQGKSPSRQGKI